MVKAKKKAAIKRVKKIVAKKIKKVEAKIKTKRLPKLELKKYKTLLLKEREEIGGELSNIARYTLNKSQRDASGDLSGYSYHMADTASDTYEMDFSLSRATDEQKLLFAIDEALSRIDEGTYGGCLQCGKLIPKNRLRALPHTAVCIECKKKNEEK